MIQNHFIPHDLGILMTKMEGQRKGVLCTVKCRKQGWMKAGEKDASGHQSITSQSRRNPPGQRSSLEVSIKCVCVYSLITVALRFHLDLTWRWLISGVRPCYFFPSMNARLLPSCLRALLPFCHAFFPFFFLY